MSTVLVVAPHPDDETLGCGGTLLRHLEEEDSVHWLIMTNPGAASGFSEEWVVRREKEINDVAQAYPLAAVHKASFETTLMDTISMKVIVDEISGVVNELQPEIVYLPYRNDVHSDHTKVFDAVVSCTKSFRCPWIRKIRAYETVSETDFSLRPDIAGFRPNLFVDITKYFDRKIEIAGLFSGEMGIHPFPRSEENLTALAIYRGSLSGCVRAEAFMSLKEIW